MEINKIGILGAGIMGSGIAQVASMSGFQVVVRDLSDEFLNKGRSNEEDSIQRMVKKDKINGDQAKKIMGNIKWTTEISELSIVEVLIEAVPEDVELKKGVCIRPWKKYWIRMLLLPQTPLQ